MTLQRLVLTFKPEELIIHALYRNQEGPGPGTKARTKEVRELARASLTQAMEALESAECVGTSGFTTREDVLLATTSSEKANLVKGAR
jgi:hypothetical protein